MVKNVEYKTYKCLKGHQLDIIKWVSARSITMWKRL